MIKNIDLASRSIAFASVFATLTVFGFINRYEFFSTIEKEYPPIQLEIVDLNIEQNINTQKQVQTSPSTTKLLPSKVVEKKEVIKEETAKVKQEPIVAQESKEKAKPKAVKREANKVQSKPKVKQQNTANTSTAKVSQQQAIDQAIANNKKFATDVILNQLRSSLRYPPNAIKRRIEGTVIIEFTIQNGNVMSYKLIQSSGFAVLDRAASKLADKFIGFNTKSHGDLKLNIPIQYSLYH